MNNGGGGESSKETESCFKKQRKNDEFAHAIVQIAVAQVCESVGFQGFQQSALDTFSDVACKYVIEVGKSSNSYANLVGRTECNVFDIIQGLEDLNMSQGFVGASCRDNCLLGLGIVKDLSQFVNLSEEIGFAYSVPKFPVTKEQKLTSSFLQTGETPPSDDIPPWLPVFLDPVTEETQIVTDGIEQQKVLEPLSSKLEQRDNNPFLSVPLKFGEKDISVISLPAKLKDDEMVQNGGNHVFELDQSGQTNKALKNGCETNEGSGIVVLENRPTVQMKFDAGKKSSNDIGKGKVGTWFVNDEKTEKVVTGPMDVEENTRHDSVVN
ncbi:transcription initiation factor TFIID subunit 8-like [Bidens hawaiensis]|uniref:transcription initiation factor TFIID subunit 8-like n=1 Tax=Bidens hawaiensis TaxID=980011 RepID=UPI004049CF25